MTRTPGAAVGFQEIVDSTIRTHEWPRATASTLLHDAHCEAGWSGLRSAVGRVCGCGGRGPLGDALQLWGCWRDVEVPFVVPRVADLPSVGLVPLREYWVGGRCEAGCHSVQLVLSGWEMECAADLAELMRHVARNMLADLAIMHWAPGAGG